MKLMAAGDQVLVAEFGDRIDEAVNDQVHALAAKIEEQQIPGIGEVVPTFRSLLIYYDSYQLSYREAADKIEELARTEDEKADFENSMLLWGAVWSGSGRHGTVDRAGSERDD